MPKDWVIAAPWTGREQLATQLKISPVLAQVLHNRGLDDVDRAAGFLAPRMGDLFPPEELPGVSEAAERLADAVRRGRKIVIYGDYDVDGITGVSILWHCLRIAGATVDYYIPNRLEEGYGVNIEAIDQLAEQGAEVVVTVDCGVTAIEPATRAKELGIEFIITDHHNAHTTTDQHIVLPDALVVHPGIPMEGGKRYANPDLSGAGVAFKLAWGVAKALCESDKVTPEFRQFLIDATGLAGLGIIADVVPLHGENRILAHFGLRGLEQSHLPGVKALIDASRLSGSRLSGYDIGFKLAPRLNAIGRMGCARLAVEMLTRADAGEAVKIAEHLEKQNRQRQNLQRRIADEAIEMVSATGQDSDSVRGIVLASPNWHAGVIGIVASRVTETFGRPTVMIALENGVGQGSARSIKNFALHEVFGDCRDHLLSYGGHAMAAGLKIDAKRVDEFRAAFHDRAARLLTPADLNPSLRIDDEVPLAMLDRNLVNELARLEPFGAGNPAPRFATEWLELADEPRVVGKNGGHLQVRLTDGRSYAKGIGFGMAKHADTLREKRRCRVAFQPILNEWNGRVNVELQIVDFQFPN